MNKRKINILFAASILFLSGSSLCSAHDFSVVDKSGAKYFFNVTDTLRNTVELTYEGRITLSDDTFFYEGELQIPSKVKFRDVVYRVASIGPKAFAGCTGITGIVIPSGVEEIKDFAFDGCSSLSKVIFPSNSVLMGEGVFFRCPSVKTVTLGGDWSAVDFRIFEWSDSLKSVRIPAKVRTVRNFKALKNLESVEVDPNNSNFTSVDGLLYNKDLTVLYGCPRNRVGEIVIPEGVESVLEGALKDCKRITSVELPSTIIKISYMEFAAMDSLEQVCMRSCCPVMTTEIDGTEVFLFKMPKNSDMTLLVPKSALKAYRDAVRNVPAESADGMLGKKNIKGVKSFEKK